MVARDSATTNVFPLLPRLVLNRQFVQDFIAQGIPTLALGMVEERKQRFACLALRLDEHLPPDIAARGFNLGHSLLGSARFEVIHFAFEFYGFKTYTVLLNANNPIVQAVVASMIDHGGYFILAIGREGEATAFRADVGQGDLAGLKANIQRIRRSATTDEQYEALVAQFRRRPYPPGPMLEWTCRNSDAALNPSQDPLELSPAPAQRPASPAADEPRVLAERLAARVRELEGAGIRDLGLFAGMAELMPLFKQLLDLASPQELSTLCVEHPGLYRYAKLLETIASGVDPGGSEVPR
jgi:hypothetical protein